LQLIGAGLPRTGTLSQKVALEMAGLGPCYHMVNIFADLDQINAWDRVLSGELDIRAIVGEFGSCVDWPASYYYEELMRLYPDAKVLLSVRDPEAWERSMRATIWESLYGSSLMAELCRARRHVEPDWRRYMSVMSSMWEKAGFVGGAEAPAGALAEAMERHNERVIAGVPSDRLLVWSVSDGWEPLCEFLGLPVPDAPFPRANDAEQFAERIVDASLQTLQRWRNGGSSSS